MLLFACSDVHYDTQPLFTGAFAGEWHASSAAVAAGAPEHFVLQFTHFDPVPSAITEHQVYGRGALEWGGTSCSIAYTAAPPRLEYVGQPSVVPWRESAACGFVDIMPANDARGELLFVSVPGASQAWQYRRVAS